MKIIYSLYQLCRLALRAKCFYGNQYIDDVFDFTSFIRRLCIDDNYKERLFLYIFISDRTYSRRCNGFGVYNYEAQIVHYAVF